MQEDEDEDIYTRVKPEVEDPYGKVAPPKPEADAEIHERLIEAFVDKKRASRRSYKYVHSPKNTVLFNKAAILCHELQINPAEYVQIIWDRMGDKKEFFGPQHLQGEAIKHAIEEMKNSFDYYKIEINNATLPYDDLWKYQHLLASNYINHGEDIHDVLMDSSIKFFAWFRILYTPEKDDEVIKKYRKIAKQEITKDFEEFAKKYELDLRRIG